MAIGPWQTYEPFVEHQESGVIDLAGDSFRVALFAATSNAGTLTHEEFGNLTNELATGDGYTAGGELVQNVSLTRSGRVLTWTWDPVVWTASGGTLTALYAVIYKDGAAGGLTNPLVAVAEWDPAISADDGETIPITPHDEGVIVLAGGLAA